jgi:hypothetical protein
MLKFTRCVLPIVSLAFLALVLPDIGRADLLTFDDANLGPFNYTNFRVLTDPCSGILAGTGYCFGVVFAPNDGSVSNPTEPFSMTYTGTGTFTFNSVYVTSPFSPIPTASVTITGYLNNVLLDSQTIGVHPSGLPVLFTANWSGINELVFSPECVGIACSGEEGVVVDNLSFTANAPEPPTVSELALAGMLALAWISVRRRCS